MAAASLASHLNAVFTKYAASVPAPINSPAPTGPEPLQPNDPYKAFQAQQELFKPKIPSAPIKPLAAPLQPKPAEQLTRIQPNQTGGAISLNTPPSMSPPSMVVGSSAGAVTAASPQSQTVPTTSGPATPITPQPGPNTAYTAGGVANTPSTPQVPGKFDNFAQDMIATGKQPAGAVIDMTQPVNTEFVAKQISDQKIPVEQRTQIAEMFIKDHLNQNPVLREGLQDIQAGRTDTEAARSFMAKLEAQKSAFIEAHPQEAATPQGFGKLMQQWETMPFASKALMGVGLPLGLVGVMSALFGKGGMGMGILGLLGLGAAGVGGAMGGMFGEGAQSGVNDMLLNAGEALGVVPAGKQDLSALVADNPAEAAVSQSGGGSSWAQGTDAVKAQLAKAEEQKQQLQQLVGLPAGLRNSLLMRSDSKNIKSVADAERAFENAQQLLTSFDDPESPVGKQLAAGGAYTDGGKTWYGRGGQVVDGARQIGGVFQDALTDPMGYANRTGVAARNALGGMFKNNAYKYAGGNTMNILKLVEKWADNKNTPCSCGCGDTVATCKCSADCSCRKPSGSCYKGEKTASKPGLWANIHAKRKRGEKPAKPGDKDYPAAKSWKKTVKSSSSPAWQRSASKNGAIDQAVKWAFNDVDAKELADLKTEQSKKYDLDNARRLHELEKRQQVSAPASKANTVAAVACQKAARCWSGYEPVPGSKKYSKGSCRPKGSKKTQKEMKK